MSDSETTSGAPEMKQGIDDSCAPAAAIEFTYPETSPPNSVEAMRQVISQQNSENPSVLEHKSCREILQDILNKNLALILLFNAKSLVIILTRVVVVCKHLARFSFHSQDWHKVYMFILQGSCRIGYPCTLGNNQGNDSEVDSNSASAVADDNLPMGKIEESESDVKRSGGVCFTENNEFIPFSSYDLCDSWDQEGDRTSYLSIDHYTPTEANQHHSPASPSHSSSSATRPPTNDSLDNVTVVVRSVNGHLFPFNPPIQRLFILLHTSNAQCVLRGMSCQVNH